MLCSTRARITQQWHVIVTPYKRSLLQTSHIKDNAYGRLAVDCPPYLLHQRLLENIKVFIIIRGHSKCGFDKRIWQACWIGHALTKRAEIDFFMMLAPLNYHLSDFLHQRGAKWRFFRGRMRALGAPVECLSTISPSRPALFNQSIALISLVNIISQPLYTMFWKGHILWVSYLVLKNHSELQ